MSNRTPLDKAIGTIALLKADAKKTVIAAAEQIKRERELAAERLGIQYVVIKAEDFIKITPAAEKDHLLVDGALLYEMGYGVNPLMKVIVFKRDEFEEMLKYCGPLSAEIDNLEKS